MSICIFGYGSLINGDSLYKTIERKLSKEEMIPVILTGYKRVWNYKAKVFSTSLNKKIDAVYLNITGSTNDHINGVIFEVTENELEKLKRREKYYSIIEISDKITHIKSLRVYTFICYDNEHLADLKSDSYIMQKYIDIVYSGCADISLEFKSEFEKTTQILPFEIIEGDYQFI